MQTFVGIDGGLNGSLVAVRGRKILECIVMPTVEGGNNRLEYDVSKIIAFFNRYPDSTIILEKAQCTPKLGSLSAFSFGKSYGLMIGVLVALERRHHLVAARAWQTIMFKGQAYANTKAASAIVAKRLFPAYDFRATARSKKVHDGKTDAVLICVYAQTMNLQ